MARSGRGNNMLRERRRRRTLQQDESTSLSSDKYELKVETAVLVHSLSRNMPGVARRSTTTDVAQTVTNRAGNQIQSPDKGVAGALRPKQNQTLLRCNG
jgi:hypothetical protein